MHTRRDRIATDLEFGSRAILCGVCSGSSRHCSLELCRDIRQLVGQRRLGTRELRLKLALNVVCSNGCSLQLGICGL